MSKEIRGDVDDDCLCAARVTTREEWTVAVAVPKVVREAAGDERRMRGRRRWYEPSLGGEDSGEDREMLRDNGTDW